MRFCDPVDLALIDVQMKLVVKQTVANCFIYEDSEARKAMEVVYYFAWELIRDVDEVYDF